MEITKKSLIGEILDSDPTLAPYFFEAIKLRYSEYFDDED